MTVTVIFMVIGLAATVGGFFLNIILGVVCGVVVMVSLDADTEVSSHLYELTRTSHTEILLASLTSLNRLYIEKDLAHEQMSVLKATWSAYIPPNSFFPSLSVSRY